MQNALIYTFVFLAIQAMVPVLASLGLTITGHAELAHSPYMLIGISSVSSLLTILMFLRMRWAEASGDYLLSRPYMVICWSMLAAVGGVVPSMFIQEQLPELPNIVEEELAAMMSVKGGYFVICLLVPLAEELVMRGAILRALLMWKPERHWLMIVISALIFALIHLNLAQMPHAFVIGLLLGWMFYRTNSIVPTVVYHWVNNTVAFILFKLYPNSDLRLVDVLGTQQSVFLAVAFSLLILLPAIYQLHVWMKK
jgi:hypothetical protein